MQYIQPKQLGAAYPLLCQFLRLTALCLNRKQVVLIVKIDYLRPVAFHCGRLSQPDLQAIIQTRLGFVEQAALPSEDAAIAPPLVLMNAAFNSSDKHEESPLLIGQFQAAGLQTELTLYMPGLQHEEIAPKSLKILEILSQQLVLSLKIHEQCKHLNQVDPNDFRKVYQASDAFSPNQKSLVRGVYSLAKPAERQKTLRPKGSPQWVELFSELQACLSFKQLKHLLEIYLPVLLPQHTARLVSLNKPNSKFVLVARWGEHQTNTKQKQECCFSITSSTRSSDGFSVCHQCYLAQHSDPKFICIVLGVIDRKAYVLQLFLSEFSLLNAEQISLIQHLSKQLQAVMQRLQLFEDLQTKALQDPLTGLENRRYMQTMLESLCLNAIPGFQISVFLIDIDHFKRVNDTYGHQAGDAVLKDVSILLKGHVRTKDMVCRYGGEEFCMVLLDTTLDVAQKRAEKIRRAVKYLNVFFAGQPLDPLTVSIGVAQFPVHGQTPEELIAKADKALYWAKNNGRDQTASFSQLLEISPAMK